MKGKQLKQNLMNIQHQGWLEKESRILKTWRKRWCVLTPLYLFTFKEAHNYDSPTETLQIAKIQGLGTCDEEIHRQWSFKVETNEQSFCFTGESNSSVQLWLGHIGNCLNKIKGQLE